MRPVYIMLVGLPGSGKSTLRSYIVERWATPIVTLSTDDWIESLAKGLNLTYNAVFAQSIKGANNVLCNIRQKAMDAGADMIHDQTSLSSKRRRGSLLQVRRGYTKIGILCQCSEYDRQRRLAGRPGKVIPPNVDQGMRDAYTPPTLEEGFDAVALAQGCDNVLGAYFKR